MHNPQLTKTFVAEAAVTKRRIVKLGTAERQVVQAAAATDALVGIAAELDGAAGGRIDVHLSGLVEVEYGGNVTRGALLTADADGKAVAAAPAAGVNNRIIGIALLSGAAGDIGSVQLLPGQIQG